MRKKGSHAICDVYFDYKAADHSKNRDAVKMGNFYIVRN